MRPGLPEDGGEAVKRAALYGLAASVYGLALLALAAVEAVLMQGLWRPFDIASYYGLADSAASSIGALMDAVVSPPLLLFDARFLSGYEVFAIAAFCLSSAMLVLEIGRRLYGDAAGFVAGLLFALSISGAQGHMAIAEAIALTLALLSAYALLFAGGRYLTSGFCAGAAMCLQPLAALLVPASLLIIYKKGQLKGILAFAGAALIPLILIAMTAFTVYGGNAVAMVMDSGFEALGLVTGESYRSPDALMAVANIALSACMLASLLPLALLGFSRSRGLPGEYFLAAGLCFVATLALKQYFHYWFFALPFLALLCASVFSRRTSDG